MFGDTFVGSQESFVGSQKSFILLGCTGLQAPSNFYTVPALSTYYAIPFMNGLFSITPNYPIPIDGTLKNLSLRFNGAQPTTGNFILTVALNGLPTSLQIIVPSGDSSQTYLNDTVSINCPKNSLLRFDLKNNANPESTPTPVAISVLLEL